MPTLYTYTLRVDHGSAPNPFGPCCTLTICKPQIRRSAQVGDWIAGFGSHNSGRGNYHGRLVYAMRVTEKLTLQEYDERCCTRKRYAVKLPDPGARDPRRHVGDALYDFSGSQPRQRPGNHLPEHMPTDLGGRYSLLSSDFIYLGHRACTLPPYLRAIVPAGRAYRSRLNQPHLKAFVDWLRRTMRGSQRMLANPINWHVKDTPCRTPARRSRRTACP